MSEGVPHTRPARDRLYALAAPAACVAHARRRFDSHGESCASSSDTRARKTRTFPRARSFRDSRVGPRDGFGRSPRDRDSSRGRIDSRHDARASTRATATTTTRRARVDDEPNRPRAETRDRTRASVNPLVRISDQTLTVSILLVHETVRVKRNTSASGGVATRARRSSSAKPRRTVSWRRCLLTSRTARTASSARTINSCGTRDTASACTGRFDSSQLRPSATSLPKATKLCASRTCTSSGRKRATR